MRNWLGGPTFAESMELLRDGWRDLVAHILLWLGFGCPRKEETFTKPTVEVTHGDLVIVGPGQASVTLEKEER